MKAVIMAGGEGARLRPLTLLRPKPMAPVLDIPVMEHIIRLLTENGIREVAVTLHYLPGEISSYFGDGSEFGLAELRYFREEEGTPLGTAGSVGQCRDFLNEDFVVISGDALTDLPLREMEAFHREKGALATVAVKRVAKPNDYGIVMTDGESRITGFIEKPDWSETCCDAANTGIYLFSPGIFQYIGAYEASDFAQDVFPKLLSQCADRFFAWETEAYWCDIGNWREYLRANLDAARGKCVNTRGEKDGACHVGFNSAVSSEAVLKGSVFLGENCVVGSGAELEDCVIGPGCVIGERSRLRGSVLWNNARLEQECCVTGSVLCEGVVLEHGARCEEAVLGSNAVCGSGSVVCRGVKLWPGVRLAPETVAKRSVIGPGDEESLHFCERGIDAETLTKRLPSETMARLGCAVGNVFGFSASVIVCSNRSGASLMLALAVCSGLASTGVKVRRAEETELAVIRWACRNGAADGAVYIDNNGPLTVTLLDGHGNDLPRGLRKKVQRAFSRDEFTVVAEKDVPEPEPLADPEDYYVADIGRQFPYAYRAFRLKSPVCGRERREALTAYMTAKLYPDAPIFISVNSALAAKSVAEKLGKRIIKCGGKVGDVMEAMEPFMQVPGVYSQYLMLYDDFAFEMALCNYKALTGEDAEQAEIQDCVVKKRCEVGCDQLRKAEILRRLRTERRACNAGGFDGDFESVDGLFSWNEKGAVRIAADESRPVFNLSVESFDEEYAEDLLNGFSSLLRDL